MPCLLSSSIDAQVRGDENTRCGQLAQFRSERVFHPNEFGRRKRSAYVHRNNYLCDIEMMSDMSDPSQCQRYKKKSRGRSYQMKTTTMHPYENDDYGGYGESEDDEAEYPEPEYPFDSNSGRSLVDVASNAISQCPVENGVMRTKWGAVSAGPLIAGIAAGLVQQNVGTYDLLKLTRNYNAMPRRQQAPPNGRFNNNRQSIPLKVDNRWAATLAGDLSEVTLLQGPMTKDVSVGAAGAWNSTSNPHWYFLSQRERLEMTDAEIRGGIDGLALGMNIADWQGQISQLRLSQVLDMYYSNRGILSPKFRSCNRRDLFAEYVKPDQLQMQTIAFSTVLEREMTLQWTLSNENIEQFSGGSTRSLNTYVSNGLNDVSCDVTSPMGAEVRTATDLHIFVETTWQFNEIQPNLMALLQDLDINPYNSQVTLYNANDCSVMVNTTTSVSDVASNWNQTSHTMKPSGLNLAAIIKKIREIGGQILNDERTKSQAGGRSFICLVVPQLTGVSESDSNYVAEELDHIYETVPDLKLLFWSGGSQGRFSRFVVDQQRDLFPLMAFGSSGDNSQQINANVLPVVQRIRSVPRRIGNPRCNSEWQESDSGSNSIDQYVEPSGINFYRLHPNYFFRSSGIVRIQGRYQTQIRVCSSRSVELPRYSNSTQNENVNCRTLMNTESFDIDLNNACYDYSLIRNCPPYYISVEAISPTTQTYFQCSDANCRFFDEIKFSINTENLGCYSRTSKTVFQSIVLVFSLGLILFQKLAL